MRERQEPAFPVVSGPVYYGMSLRDYFAAAALQGMMVGDEWARNEMEEIAEAAYQIADAMMEEREKGDE